MTNNNNNQERKPTLNLIIRSLFFYFVFYTIAIFFSTFMALFFFSSIAMLYIGKIWSICILFLLKHICNLDYEITGLENIPTDKHFIVASKHQSVWETYAYQAFFFPTIFVMKKEILYVPMLNIDALIGGHIFINRGKTTKSDLIRLTKTFDKRLKTKNIVVFPEGTRTKIGETDKYKSGLSIITKGLDTLIVPVAMNAGSFWGKNSIIKYPGTIKVHILKPIETGTLKPTELQQKLITTIENEMKIINE